MARCLVTGGAGFVGSHLVEALVGAGHQVRVLDDLSSGQAENLRAVQQRIELRSGSVTQADAVGPAMHQVDWVFHLAAIASVQRSVEDPLTTHQVCATGTLLVLEAARQAGVQRVVYAGSSSAYGNQPGAVRTEDDPLSPTSPYAAAKLAGEHYCQAYTATHGLETVRLRFFNIFGPRQDPRSPYSGVIALFSAAMAAGRTPTVHGDGLQSRDFVYVTDAVQALMLAAQSPAAVGQILNIGTGMSTTVLDLVHHLNQLLGRQIQPIHGPARAGDVRHSQADITRARKDLGYAPSIAFPEGLRRTLEAFERQTAKG